MKNVWVLSNPALGWDCICCIGESPEAVAYYMEYSTLYELNQSVVKNKMQFIKKSVATLPEKTLEKSIKKHW